MTELAQTDLAPPVDRAAVEHWLDRANTALADLPQAIDRIDLPVAVVLILVGIVSLLYGYRIVKGMVIVYSCVGGAAAGWYLATDIFNRPDFWWVGLLAGGAVMALLAWPLVNFLIGAYGAMAGGLAGFAITQAVGDQRAMLIGVGIGVVVGGLLAWLVLRFMVVVMTSILGAHLTVIGIVAVLYRVGRVGAALREALAAQQYLLPLVVAMPAVVGMIYQLYRTESREAAGEGEDEA